MSSRNPFSNRAPRSCISWHQLLPALLFLIATCTTLSHAEAQSSSRLLDGPRASGLVGERYDGYAVARAAVPANISALIDQVNSERRQLYAERARTEGVPIDAIGKIYAAEIIRSAPAGTWFFSENGQWTRK